MLVSNNIGTETWLSADESNKLLQKSVPITVMLGFEYLEVKRGYCKAVLPLHKYSANQHGTHQGLLLGVAADYTGGIALASVISNEPVLGIHNISNDKGMCLWLAKEEITYLRPSVEDVFFESIIDEAQHNALENRYHSGSTILLDVEIRLFSRRNETVAKAVFRYYCKKKTALQTGSTIQKADSMHAHLLKTNAKLLAQLRHLETKKEKPLFTDDIAMHIAGQQGQLMAERFLAEIPDLQNLVAARVFHIAEVLKQHTAVIQQVVLIGAGLDFHYYRNREYWRGKAVFELDLPSVIEEREMLEAKLGLQNPLLQSLVRIKCSVEHDTLAELLLLNGFDTTLPTLFIYEGGSMYMARETTNKITDEISLLMKCNTNSLLWMDMVDETILHKQAENKVIKNFLSSMARLGKPVSTGFRLNDELFEQNGLQFLQQTFAADIVKLVQPELTLGYSFVLLGCTVTMNKPFLKYVVSKNRQAFERLIDKTRV
jgi:methyltransferase (TIGR00027 family)